MLIGDIFALAVLFIAFGLTFFLTRDKKEQKRKIQ